MSMVETLNLIDNKAARARPHDYICIEINTEAVLKSWQLSVFSFEWLDQDGKIKPITALKDADQIKRQDIEKALKDGADIEKPLLGIGIQDNIEIGSGKAALLTLAAHGIKKLPVHIPKSNERDFKPFLA